MRIVCAVASAAGTAAVRSKAGGEAVACVSVCTRVGERVASVNVKRSARATRRVAIVTIKVGSVFLAVVHCRA